MNLVHVPACPLRGCRRWWRGVACARVGAPRQAGARRRASAVGAWWTLQRSETPLPAAAADGRAPRGRHLRHPHDASRRHPRRRKGLQTGTRGVAGATWAATAWARGGGGLDAGARSACDGSACDLRGGPGGGEAPTRTPAARRLRGAQVLSAEQTTRSRRGWAWRGGAGRGAVASRERRPATMATRALAALTPEERATVQWVKERAIREYETNAEFRAHCSPYYMTEIQWERTCPAAQRRPQARWTAGRLTARARAPAPRVPLPAADLLRFCRARRWDKPAIMDQLLQTMKVCAWRRRPSERPPRRGTLTGASRGPARSGRGAGVGAVAERVWRAPHEGDGHQPGGAGGRPDLLQRVPGQRGPAREHHPRSAQPQEGLRDRRPEQVRPRPRPHLDLSQRAA